MRVRDNYLSDELYLEFVNYSQECLYKYGERDDKGIPPVGMIHQLNLETHYLLPFPKKYAKFKLYRAYINCFAPGENPYFHMDDESGVTGLFYLTPWNTWDEHEGGETQLLIDNEIKGILPLPNRFFQFDANIRHRATSFRNNHRFTLALKYGI